MSVRYVPPLAAAAALFLALASVPASAQAGPGGDGPGWAPVNVGIHLGFDENSQGEVLGAQMRIPVLPSGKVELMPVGSVTFAAGLKEYHFSLDAVYTMGGRRGGLYFGGGLAVRNTIFDDPGRTTKTGWDAVVGLKSAGFAGTPIGTQLEVRWIFVDEDLKPRVLSLGVNLPLWGWGRR